MAELTQAYLKTILNYDPDTGIFTWRVSTAHRVKVGDVAGTPDKKGYIHIGINKKRYRAHRLVWFYVYGCWPTCLIDHIDMIESNNRLSNLREATNSENHANRPKQVNNTSGFKGVSWQRQLQKWQCHIMIEQRSKYLGIFNSPEAAHAAYCEAAIRHFGKFART